MDIEQARIAVDAGLINLTKARMELGTASWREHLAFRFPHLFGCLDEQARMDRLNPENSPASVSRRKMRALLTQIDREVHDYIEEAFQAASASGISQTDSSQHRQLPLPRQSSPGSGGWSGSQ